MAPPGKFEAEALASLQRAVTRALDRKRRLGQYAVFWEDGRIIFEGADAGLPEPEFTVTDRFVMTVRRGAPAGQIGGRPVSRPASIPEVTPEVMRLLLVVEGAMTRREIQTSLGLEDEKHFREFYQQPAVAHGLLEMTVPDRPTSRLQRYRLTDRGRAVVARLKPEGPET